MPDTNEILNQLRLTIDHLERVYRASLSDTDVGAEDRKDRIIYSINQCTERICDIGNSHRMLLNELTAAFVRGEQIPERLIRLIRVEENNDPEVVTAEDRDRMIRETFESIGSYARRDTNG